MTSNGSIGCETTKTCDVLVTYVANTDGSVDLTMLGNSTVLNLTKPYVALGLAETSSMANASVSFCYHSDEVSPKDGVGMSWNTKDYDNTLLSDTSLGLSKTTNTFADGILRCEYTRDQITNIPIPDVNKNQSMKFDLSKSYYLLLAVGEVKKNTELVEEFPIVLTYHSAKTASKSKISLSSANNSTSTTSKATSTSTSSSSTTNSSSPTSSTTASSSSTKTSSKTSSSTSSIATTTTIQATSTNKVPDDKFENGYKGCSKDWGCVGMTDKGETGCVNTKSCDVLVTFTKNTDTGNVNFTVLGKVADESYVAFGLSNSQSMSETSVMFCYQSASVSPSNGVGMSWNNKDYNSIVLDDPMYGLSKTSASYSDGVLSCSCTRNKLTNISIPGSNNKTAEFDLENSYYLLIAFGPVKKSNNVDLDKDAYPVTLAMHNAKHAMVSEEKVFLNISSHISTKDTKPLIRAHGCLMVLAWILFANVGMFTSKFCKKILPGKQILKADVWFRVHQGCMTLALILSIAGATILWVDRGVKPLKLENLKNNPHSALGMVVICAAVIQPVIAFFRPSPNNKFRPYFRYLHGGLGYVALILAGVAIYFATNLDEANLDEHTWIILAALLGFCFVSFVFIGLLNIHQWYDLLKLNEENFSKIIYGGYLSYIMAMLAFVFAMFSVILDN